MNLYRSYLENWNVNYDRYCIYCKAKIEDNESMILTEDNKLYHAECYNLLNSYYDELGDSEYDEER